MRPAAAGESWLEAAARRAAGAEGGLAARVLVAEVDGSAPREAGAAMLVDAAGAEGSIGGGALEHEAMAAARRLIRDGGAGARRLDAVPLGPGLGQCCGGRVRLATEVFSAEAGLGGGDPERGDPARLGAAGAYFRALRAGGPGRLIAGPEDLDWAPSGAARRARAALARGLRGPALFRGVDGADWLLEPLARPRAALQLYGAGHVGRALIAKLDGLEIDVAWVDVAAERFPPPGAPALAAPETRVRRVATADPAAAAAAAPAGAMHLVMTHSHPLDLAICAAVLRRGAFRALGLIGSATKRARFLARLDAMGLGAAARARLVCPIGLDGAPGKAPAMVALSAAAQLLGWMAEDAAAAGAAARAEAPA